MYSLVFVLVVVTNFWPGSALSVNDGAHLPHIKELRVCFFLPFVREGMRREAVFRLLGQPDMQMISKGGRGDVYDNAGFTINYDFDQKVIDVYKIRVKGP